MKYIALDMDFFSGNNCMLALEKEAARFAEDQISVTVRVTGKQIFYAKGET